MSTKLLYDDEIDLLALFKILWNNKWKIVIVTLFFLILTIIYISVKKPRYEIKTKFYNANSSVFRKYIPLNMLLTEKELGAKVYSRGTTLSNTYDGFSITKNSVMHMFIEEFNEYNELVKVLKKNKTIKNAIKNLNEYNKNSYLFGLAKSFKIKRELDEDQTFYEFNLEWHNPKEGQQILSESVDLVLLKVQKHIEESINTLAQVTENKNDDDYQKLYKKFLILEKKDKDQVTKKISFLKYHLELAKVNDKFNNNDQILNKSMTYLRGKKVISKELELLLKQNHKQIYISDTTQKVKFELEILKNDVFPEQIRNYIKIFKNENHKNFIIFNSSIADIKSTFNYKLYIIISLIFGIIIGSLFALISHYRLTKQKR